MESNKQIPLISVVVPTCNRPDFLARCLCRLDVKVQRMCDVPYEVIVTDDGNRDQSKEEMQLKFPWAIWKEGPRRGPAANRNSGAAVARGEWIVFIDDDCIPDSDILISYYRAAKNSKVLVFEGQTTSLEWNGDPRLEAPVNTGGYLWSCNMMISSQLFRELGGFDERYSTPAMEDVDLRERITKSGESFSYVPEAVVDHPPRPAASLQRTLQNYRNELLFEAIHSRHSGFLSIIILNPARRIWHCVRDGHPIPAIWFLIKREIPGSASKMLHWKQWHVEAEEQASAVH